MKTRPLIIAAAAVAGITAGVLSRGLRDTASGTHPDAAPHAARSAGLATSDPRETALGAALSELLHAKSTLRGLAELASALEQIDSPRVAILLERLERAPGSWPAPADDRIAWIFKWWLKRDAEAAGAWAQPRLAALAQEGPLGFNLERSPRAQLIGAWARANPQAALEFARSHPHTGAASLLLKEMLAAWPRERPQEPLALLLDFPASHARDVALREYYKGWAGRDPATALASAQSLPAGSVREKSTGDVLLRWADKDPAAAFGQYRALAVSDSVLLSKLLEKRAAKNPSEAIEWLQQLDPAQIARCAPKIVNAWAGRDAPAALAWALENGVRLSASSENVVFEITHDGFQRSSSMGSGGGTSALATALEKQPEATLEWLRSLPAGAERDRVAELAASATKNREQALALFAMLPAEAQARVAGAVARRFGDDQTGAREWAATLPAGPTRMQAWKGIGALDGTGAEPPPGADRDAFLIGSLDRSGIVPPPSEKLAIVLRIGDPVQRRHAFDNVIGRYMGFENFAKETRAALDTVLVPEEWKQPWRARLPSQD